MVLAAMLITRCALTLLVLGLLVLPFALGSPVSLAIDTVGITLNLLLVVLGSIAVRWSAHRELALSQADRISEHFSIAIPDELSVADGLMHQH